MLASRYRRALASSRGILITRPGPEDTQRRVLALAEKPSPAEAIALEDAHGTANLLMAEGRARLTGTFMGFARARQAVGPRARAEARPRHQRLRPCATRLRGPPRGRGHRPRSPAGSAAPDTCSRYHPQRPGKLAARLAWPMSVPFLRLVFYRGTGRGSVTVFFREPEHVSGHGSTGTCTPRTGIRPPVAVWTPAQTAAFLNGIRGHRLYAAYHLIALRGLRRGEACGLRWCDIDLDSGTAIISWQLQQYDGHVVLCPPKTARSERIVALDRTTVAALRAHRSRQLAERAAAGEDYLDSGYVFTRPGGDPMAPDWLSRYFRQLNTASGLPPIRLHDLRHGAASLALAAGADLKVVQDMLGHSSIVLTADTYTSVLPEVARKAAEDIASLIIAAGCLIPGTQERRRPAWQQLRRHAHAVMTAGLSLAHPARQVAGPYRRHAAQPLAARGQEAQPGGPAVPGFARAAIPWPTSAHTATPANA